MNIMEKPIDILNYLSKIVEENTLYYQSDFVNDQATLYQAAQEHDPDDRTFYWMSRHTGTWCVKERDVFIRESTSHSIWTYYEDAGQSIRAYRIFITGLKNGRVMGNVRRLNYQQQVQRVLCYAMSAESVTLEYQSGFIIRIPYRKYRETAWTFHRKGDGIAKVRFDVADSWELTRVLNYENQEQISDVKKQPRHPKKR